MRSTDEIMQDLERGGTRRCLICSRINPCAEHSHADQRAELARNDAEIAKIRVHVGEPTHILPDDPIRGFPERSK